MCVIPMQFMQLRTDGKLFIDCLPLVLSSRLADYVSHNRRNVLSAEEVNLMGEKLVSHHELFETVNAYLFIYPEYLNRINCSNHTP